MRFEKKKKNRLSLDKGQKKEKKKKMKTWANMRVRIVKICEYRVVIFCKHCFI